MEAPHPWRLVSGHRYAYVRVRDVGRVSFPLSGCATDAEADVRARLLLRAVEQLVAVGAGACVKTLGVRLGRAASAAEIEEARAAIARAVGEGRANAGDVVTVRQFAQRWTSGELHRAHKDYVKAIDHTDNESRFEIHICPIIGDRPIAELALEDGERVMASLPEGLSAGTRRQVAQCMYRLSRLAVYPAKLLALPPFPVGFLPKLARPKAAPFLYPAEEAQLVGCIAIPLVRRIVYGFVAREGVRAGELVGMPARPRRPEVPPMDWGAIDLVNEALRLDRNKTGDARAWALSPGMAAALRAWKTIAGEGHFVVGKHRDLARHLRADLKRAGVTRAELFVRTERRAWMKEHHLRATFVTLSLANGRTETWVKDRTGHRSSEMVETYRRVARMAAELRLGELAPLDQAIPELRS